MPVYRLSKAHVKARVDISTIFLRLSYAFPTPFLHLSYTIYYFVISKGTRKGMPRCIWSDRIG